MPYYPEFLEDKVIDWLLERDNPSIRYFTLINLLERPLEDIEVIEAHKDIMKNGIVPKILSKQEDGCHWGVAEDFYRSKYRGTVWSLIILAEFEADPYDPRIIKACDFILDRSQDTVSGAFSYISDASGHGSHSSTLPCLTGNMIWSLIRLGCLNDKRVRKGIDNVVKYYRCDDGVKNTPSGWPYDNRISCWGNHTCFMGVVKSLKALAEIPKEERPDKINDAIDDMAEFMLMHHIYKKSHDVKSISKPVWTSFSFPLMWNTDALEIPGILVSLGFKDERMQDAIDLVLSKRDKNGTWKQDGHLGDRFLARVERKGKPSKWVTLNALKALKGYYA